MGLLYTLTWETNFGEQLATRGHEPIPASLPNGERPSAAEANSSDAHENQTDYIITRDELNDATDAANSRTERINDDVSKRNEASEATRNEESDWPNPAFYPKNRAKSSPDTSERLENDANLSEKIQRMKKTDKIIQKGGMILSVPNYPKTMLEIKI